MARPFVDGGMTNSTPPCPGQRSGESGRSKPSGTETTHILEGLEADGLGHLTKSILAEVRIARMQVHLANDRRGHGARSALDATGRWA